MTERLFSINDADGNPHEYRVRLHSVQQGEPIMYQLYALAAEPVAGIAQVAMALLDGRTLGDLMKINTNDLDLDLSGVGVAIKHALMTTNMPKLRKQLLANTWRDDKAIGTKPAEFESAFQGNYGELVVLLWRVVEANRFLPLSAISSLVEVKAPELSIVEGEQLNG